MNEKGGIMTIATNELINFQKYIGELRESFDKLTAEQIKNGTNWQVRPRVLGVVFGVYLSARAVFRLDPEYSGPAIRQCV